MKLLLVLGSDETHALISLYVKPLGFELIRYNQILKAMDNLDEIDPSAIVISARDFPRHWKTMVQFVRSERSKDICPIIILKGENFSADEASKAFYLGVSGIVTEALDDITEIDRIQGILSRYMPIEEKRRSHRFKVETWMWFGFVFTHPLDNIMVTGEVKDVSSQGLSFLPNDPSLLKNITLNMDLRECSFRVGDSILSPVCRLTRAGPSISMEIVSFPNEEQEIMDKYIESLPLRELENRKKRQVKTTA